MTLLRLCQKQRFPSWLLRLRWFLRNKVLEWFFWNFPNMFLTKHCFEKYIKNDRSPCLQKGWWWTNLISFIPNHNNALFYRFTFHFAVAGSKVFKRNTWRETDLRGRKWRAYARITESQDNINHVNFNSGKIYTINYCCLIERFRFHESYTQLSSILEGRSGIESEESYNYLCSITL